MEILHLQQKLLVEDKTLAVKLKRQELSFFLQERAKGALIQTRSITLGDTDGPTAFFFSLKGNNEQLLNLKTLDGDRTSDPFEMWRLAAKFCTDLYAVEDVDQWSVADILQQLPEIRPAQKQTLDSPITLQEVTIATRQLSTGRAPSVDGPRRLL